MRLWENAKGNLIGDEQVLAYLASHGSLSKALLAGDIRLVAGGSASTAPQESGTQRKARRNHAKLATLL